MTVSETAFDWIAANADICPVVGALDAAGTRTAFLLMREASQGVTRFDEFVRRVGVTEASAAARLRDLVAAGLLEKRPYREAGQRTRDEYVLTESGADFLPVVFALFAWGRAHAPGRDRVDLVHRGCEEPVGLEIRCAAGHPLTAGDTRRRLRPESG